MIKTTLLHGKVENLFNTNSKLNLCCIYVSCDRYSIRSQSFALLYCWTFAIKVKCNWMNQRKRKKKRMWEKEWGNKLYYTRYGCSDERENVFDLKLIQRKEINDFYTAGKLQRDIKPSVCSTLHETKLKRKKKSEKHKIEWQSTKHWDRWCRVQTIFQIELKLLCVC